MNKMKPCEKLKNLRYQKNKQRIDVAIALDVSYQTIVSWETGRRIPGDAYKTKLAEYYNTTVQDLFFN